MGPGRRRGPTSCDVAVPGGLAPVGFRLGFRLGFGLGFGLSFGLSFRLGFRPEARLGFRLARPVGHPPDVVDLARPLRPGRSVRGLASAAPGLAAS